MDIPSTVSDDEKLYRHINPLHIKDDGTVTSAAFTDSEMSVDRAKYRELAESLESHPGWGCASFEAAFARSLKQEVISIPELLNPAHAHVVGKKTKSIARKLAKESVRVQ